MGKRERTRSTGMHGLGYCLVCVAIGLAGRLTAHAHEDVLGAFSITSDFPGGNIVVLSVKGNTVQLHQDERDTPRFWFYWCFDVHDAQGRTVTFQFTKGNVFGSRGPAVSTDSGQNWAWLGREACDGDAFQYTFAAESRRVRFAFAIPYTESNLRKFLERHADHPALRSQELVQSGQQRSVELLRAGRIDGTSSHRILLTCRHHACESVANLVLEGVLEAALEDTDLGRGFREHVELITVPFMDKDGVESGDQGKLRTPHDHWLDYLDESRYVETRTLRSLMDAEDGPRPIDIALDLHCPHLRDTKIYFALGANPKVAESTQRLCRLFEQRQRGPLVYRAADNSLFGIGWNVPATYADRRSFWQWAETLSRIQAVATLEMPYASVGDVAVTPESARAVGRDLAEAMLTFLRQSR